MRELPDELLAGGLVVVDERAAILEESGEVRHALDAGAIGVDDLVELGVALTDGVERTPRTSFKSVGVADAGLGGGAAARATVPGLISPRGSPRLDAADLRAQLGVGGRVGGAAAGDVDAGRRRRHRRRRPR